jgi:hypothetical protein
LDSTSAAPAFKLKSLPQLEDVNVARTLCLICISRFKVFVAKGVKHFHWKTPDLDLYSKPARHGYQTIQPNRDKFLGAWRKAATDLSHRSQHNQIKKLL